MPVPAAGEVLIKVAAAGVNRPDVFQRLGRYPPPPGASDIPGLEVAGTIEQLGPGVSALRVGDAVCALVAGGGYAEYCVAPAPQCLPVPRGMDLVVAAAHSGNLLHRLDQRLRARTPAGRRVAARARRLERHRHDRDPARARARRRASSRPRDRRRSARPANGSAPSAPSTTARPTSSPSSASSPPGVASTSCSTWSAASTSRATSTCWRWKGGWSRLRRCTASRPS